MNISKQVVDIVASHEGAHRIATFRWILGEYFSSQASNDKLVDLGAGPCVFSRIAVKADFDVTAVDARDERLPEDLTGIKFIKSDVREFDLLGFDVVLIFGLLYHLTLEDQLQLLSRCPENASVIIDTQVHIPESVQEEACQKRKFNTKKIEESQGFSGVLFPEEQNPMASIGNTHSWWHTEPSLLKLLEQVGFKDVIMIDPTYISKYGARRFYVCSK